MLSSAHMAVAKSQASQHSFVPDERQLAAIEHVRGPLLVVAGAGTGKTSVLVHRIARLIAEGHARPDEILALTYTDNAAREMFDRVRSEVRGADVRGLQAATFHAYCNNLLIRNGKGFGVLDDKDLWIYLRRRIRELKLKHFVRAANVVQFLDDLLDFIRRCHDELVGPEQYAKYVQRLQRGELPIPRVARSKEAAGLADEEILGRCREIANVFATVERWLQEDNLGTFSHMITRAHALLERDEKLRPEERRHARFILVDEFQDANFAQVKILAQLAGDERNIFAVGDPDQAIYRFRGASSAAFSLFQRQFPGARVVVLGKNRRSTTPILRCAFALIEKNPPVLASVRGEDTSYPRAPLQSAREEEAAHASKLLASVPVEAVSFAGKEAEGPDVVGVIQEKRRRLRCAWNRFGVLYRSHSHRDEVVEELAQRDIPFSIENMDVMDTPEVRDLLACLGAVVSVGDDAGLFRVAALPQFNVNPEQLRTTLRALAKDAREGQSANLASVLREVQGGASVLETVEQVREDVARTRVKGRAALETIGERFALDLSSQPLQAALKFVDDWEQKATTKTGELSELLEYLNYFREARGAIPMASHDEDAVRLMTAHAAKGLEFDHVFILRANAGSFPCGYKETLVEFPQEFRDPDSVAEDDDKALHEQEERRLFYVAMTRARDSLTIYAKQGSGKDKTPAGLLRELLKESSLRRWLAPRAARGFQTDMFAAAVTQNPSRTEAWLALPPASDLHTRLSASAVESYETCPLQFKLEREWRMPREVPAAAQYGAAMHRVLRTYYDAVRYGRAMGEEELLERFRADLADAGIQDRYQYELYEKQGLEQLHDFLAQQRERPLPNVLHTEEWFEVRIGGADVVGRIDRIDRLDGDRVAIVDYKTGKPRSQQDADESLQLSIYALAAREKWGYRPDCIVFHNLEENSVVTTTRSEADLAGARNRVQEVAHSIADGKFSPKLGFHCSFCPYRNLCPATEKSFYAAEKKGIRKPN